MASWHRFFLDFDRFWEASWEGNRSQDRPKKASKNDAKKKSSEIAKKIAIRISNPARNPGSWVLGRTHPYMWGEPRPSPARWGGNGPLPWLLVLTRLIRPDWLVFVLSSLVWPCSDLIWPDLTWSDRILSDFPTQLGVQNPWKSRKNRCQDAIPCWPHVLIDFWSIFGRFLIDAWTSRTPFLLKK